MSGCVTRVKADIGHAVQIAALHVSEYGRHWKNRKDYRVALSVNYLHVHLKKILHIETSRISDSIKGNVHQ